MNLVKNTDTVNSDVNTIKEHLASIYKVIQTAKSSTPEKNISDDIYTEMFTDFFGYIAIALDMMSEKAKKECFSYLEEYVKAENAKK